MGCHRTSSFYGKTKKTAWSTWSIYPEVSEAFVFIVENMFARIDCTAQFFHLEGHPNREKTVTNLQFIAKNSCLLVLVVNISEFDFSCKKQQPNMLY